MRGTKMIITVMAIVLVVGLALSIKVNGQENLNKNDKAYYRQLEDTFTMVIRNSLTKEGFINPGITVNTITKLGEEREYTVMIHHHLISEMDNDERENLIAGLEAITYPYAECSVVYKIVE